MVQWQQRRTHVIMQPQGIPLEFSAGAWALDGRSIGILSWQIVRVLSRLYNIGKLVRLLGSLSWKRHRQMFTAVSLVVENIQCFDVLGSHSCNKTTGYQRCLAWRTVIVSDITRPPKVGFHSQWGMLNVATGCISQYFPRVLQVLQLWWQGHTSIVSAWNPVDLVCYQISHENMSDLESISSLRDASKKQLKIDEACLVWTSLTYNRLVFAYLIRNLSFNLIFALCWRMVTVYQWVHNLCSSYWTMTLFFRSHVALTRTSKLWSWIKQTRLIHPFRTPHLQENIYCLSYHKTCKVLYQICVNTWSEQSLPVFWLFYTLNVVYQTADTWYIWSMI